MFLLLGVNLVLNGAKISAKLGFLGNSTPDTGWEFFSSPVRPERLWDPLTLLSKEYQELFLWK
jgi:hypothetical protein